MRKITYCFLGFTICASLVSCSPTKGNVFSLDSGDCFNADSLGEVGEVKVLDCNSSHEYEVFAGFKVPSGEWPGYTSLGNTADAECESRFKSYVGIDYENSSWFITWLVPTEDSWNQVADRDVTCVLYDYFGTTSRAARNSRS